MTIKELQLLQELRETPDLIELHEFVKLFCDYANNKLSDEEINRLRELQLSIYKKFKVVKLLERDPGELAFIVDCESYENYLKTYTDANIDSALAEYNEEEFNIIHNYFCKEEDK